MNIMEKNKLAVIISEDKHLGHIAGLIKAAAKKGGDISVSVFITDKGVFLTENKEFISLLKELGGIIDNISVCEHSCNVNGVVFLDEIFNYSSQFENAKIINELKENDRALLL
jgi:soluble P-type ATPase